jgi:hypothetical protein
MPAAQAYGFEAGTIMICDTQNQVERFARLFDGDLNVAAVPSDPANKLVTGFERGLTGGIILRDPWIAVLVFQRPGLNLS